MRKQLLLNAILLLCSVAIFAQTRTVSGSVKDANGQVIPYASILIKGTSTGTTANVDGKFKIDVKEGQSLIVSAAGLGEQELKIGSAATYDVILQPQGNLEEVVVTALGVRRNKSDLGYAAQTLNADAISKASQTDALKALSGKVAGVQITSSTGTPGGASYIQLRGANSITGNNQPLFVIDGVPIDNGQNYSGDPADGTNNVLFGTTNTNRGADINPNDIESITVLKGPAAAALYGIGAANGAIIITTKSGKEGRMLVEFSSTVSFDKVNRYLGYKISG